MRGTIVSLGEDLQGNQAWGVKIYEEVFMVNPGEAAVRQLKEGDVVTFATSRGNEGATLGYPLPVRGSGRNEE